MCHPLSPVAVSMEDDYYAGGCLPACCASAAYALSDQRVACLRAVRALLLLAPQNFCQLKYYAVYYPVNNYAPVLLSCALQREPPELGTR